MNSSQRTSREIDEFVLAAVSLEASSYLLVDFGACTAQLNLELVDTYMQPHKKGRSCGSASYEEHSSESEDATEITHKPSSGSERVMHPRFPRVCAALCCV